MYRLYNKLQSIHFALNSNTRPSKRWALNRRGSLLFVLRIGGVLNRMFLKKDLML